MKLTVCFGDTKVVVPCGAGELTVRDLAFSALKRARHTFPKLGAHDRVVVHNVSIARDGGILDWDDLVRDVLDDRELVIAQFSIATLAASTINLERPTPVRPNDELFRHMCTPLVVDLCSDAGAGVSSQGGPQPNGGSSGSGESAAGSGSQTNNHGLNNHSHSKGPNEPLLCAATVDDSNSSSSLSLNVSSGSCGGVTRFVSCQESEHMWRLMNNGQEPVGTSAELAGGGSGLHSGHSRLDDQDSEKLDQTIRQHSPLISCNQIGIMVHLSGDRSGHTIKGGTLRLATEDKPSHSAFQITSDPKVWQQGFPSTSFETLSSDLSRRRDFIDVNWDSDEEDEEDSVRNSTEDDSREDVRDLHKVIPVLSGRGPVRPIALYPGDQDTNNAGPTVVQDVRLAADRFTTANNKLVSQTPTSVATTNLSAPAPIFKPYSAMSSSDLLSLPSPPSTNSIFDVLSSQPVTSEFQRPMLNTHSMADTVVLQPTARVTQISSASDDSVTFGQTERSHTVFSRHFSPVIDTWLNPQIQETCSSIGCTLKTACSPVIPPNTNVIAQSEAVISTNDPVKSGTTSDAAPSVQWTQNEGLSGGENTKKENTNPSPSASALTGRASLSRLAGPFVCGLPVPTIVEEEEELSVDYDQSVAEENCKLTAPVPPISRSSTTKFVPVGSSRVSSQVADDEEDYPLLRPDYTVSHDQGSVGADLNEGERLSEMNKADEEVNPAEPVCFKPSVFSVNFVDSRAVSHRVTRGLPPPAVLRWIESTHAATAAGDLSSSSATATSDSGSPSVISGTSATAAQESTGEESTPKEDESEGSAQKDSFTCSMIERREPEATFPGTTFVRLMNSKLGENLGIQIKPVFMDSVDFAPQGLIASIAGHRVESGLEVHNVMPNGRVAREGCLSVGDRILNINGICLIGLSFERSRDIFQAALKEREILLEVLPKSTRRKPKPYTSEDHLPPTEAVPVAEISSHSSGKPAPPPPPRRSPHTVLTHVNSGTAISTAGRNALEHQKKKDWTKNKEEKNPHTQCPSITGGTPLRNSSPALPPKADRNASMTDVNVSSVKSRHLPKSECLSICLRKGSSGLGFSLTSRDVPVASGPSSEGDITTERIVCVKNILPDGAALLDGNLKPGDRLIEVDGLDVTILGQARTVSMLREKPVDSVVNLLVWRPPASVGSRTISAKQSSRPPPAPVEKLEPDSDPSCPRHDEIVHPSVHNSQEARPNIMASCPFHSLSEAQLYETYSVSPSKYLLFQMHIELSSPVSPTATSPGISTNSTALGDVGESPHPVTLGVSVSVRPLAVATKHGIQQSPKVDDASDNAVFVRTVIEGGPANRDGRLQVGDRLLAIDGEPLSGMSSSEALSKLKAVIAKDLLNKDPFVCLLVARTRASVNKSESPLHKNLRANLRQPHHPDTTMNFGSDGASKTIGTSPTSETKTLPSGGKTSPMQSTKGSLIVSADVHPLTDSREVDEHYEPQDCGDRPHLANCLLPVHSATADVSKLSSSQPRYPKPTGAETRSTWSHSTSKKEFTSRTFKRGLTYTTRCSSHMSTSSRSSSSRNHHRRTPSQKNNSAGPPLSCPDSAVVNTVAQIHDCYSTISVTSDRRIPKSVAQADLSYPLASPACKQPARLHRTPWNNQAHLKALDSNYHDRIYRCDSQGTISSTEMPECEEEEECRRLSDTTSTLQLSTSELEGSMAVSDPETERLSSSFHSSSKHSGASSLGRRNRLRRGEHTVYRVVVRQPRIDLSQMVLVPFDANSWTGPVLKPRSALKPSELLFVTGADKTTEDGSNADSGNAQHNMKRNFFARKLRSQRLSEDSVGSSSSIPLNLSSTVRPENTQLTPPVTDTDSTTGCKASVRSDRLNKSLHDKRTVITRLFRLVKSGTQKRTSGDSKHSGLSAGLLNKSRDAVTSTDAAVLADLPPGAIEPQLTDTETQTSCSSMVHTDVKQNCTGGSDLTPCSSTFEFLEESTVTVTADIPNLLSDLPVEQQKPTEQSVTKPSAYATLNSLPLPSGHVYNTGTAISESDKAADCLSDVLPDQRLVGEKSRTVPPSALGTIVEETPLMNTVARCKGTRPYAELSFPVVPKVEIQNEFSAIMPPPMPLLRPLCLETLNANLDKWNSVGANPGSVTGVHLDHMAPEPSTNKLGTINRLYDIDVSSCSTAYESVLEFIEPADPPASPKENNVREVYEDAEKLYQFLAEKTQKSLQSMPSPLEDRRVGEPLNSSGTLEAKVELSAVTVSSE
ncbi:unnamed protein product [Calicophoron daubneyi]|uniref:PDZ domain-containing protein n=1 Tax=Calicophoron daubneyi TaxID=300641 RepID=A0AAV2TXE3_CALDB